MTLVLGGFMILAGFLSLIRYRFVQVRRRLSPAASIRGRGFDGSPAGYGASYGGWAMGRSISVLLMLGGGAVVLAGMLG
jgi:hypothetical protein